jgi:hypothetical protein
MDNILCIHEPVKPIRERLTDVQGVIIWPGDDEVDDDAAFR